MRQWPPGPARRRNAEVTLKPAARPGLGDATDVPSDPRRVCARAWETPPSLVPNVVIPGAASQQRGTIRKSKLPVAPYTGRQDPSSIRSIFTRGRRYNLGSRDPLRIMELTIAAPRDEHSERRRRALRSSRPSSILRCLHIHMEDHHIKVYCCARNGVGSRAVRAIRAVPCGIRHGAVNCSGRHDWASRTSTTVPAWCRKGAACQAPARPTDALFHAHGERCVAL